MRDLYVKLFSGLSTLKFRYLKRKFDMKFNFQYKKDRKIFVCSDSHFHHDRIRSLCNRPFSSVEEMDNEMVTRWNNVVGTNDLVIHLGDFSMSHNFEYIKRTLSRLNGQIILVWGNHDDKKAWNKILDNDRSKVLFATDIMESSIPFNDSAIDVIFCHFPISQWNRKHHGSIHFYGHCHGTHENGIGSIDVGVDSIRNTDALMDYAPVPIEKMITLVLRQKEEARNAVSIPN